MTGNGLPGDAMFTSLDCAGWAVPGGWAPGGCVGACGTRGDGAQRAPSCGSRAHWWGHCVFGRLLIGCVCRRWRGHDPALRRCVRALGHYLANIGLPVCECACLCVLNSTPDGAFRARFQLPPDRGAGHHARVRDCGRRAGSVLAGSRAVPAAERCCGRARRTGCWGCCGRHTTPRRHSGRVGCIAATPVLR